MKAPLTHRNSGFTMAELMMSLVTFGLVAISVMSFLNFGMMSFAKNLSVNSSHNTTRVVMDRIGNSINTCSGEPKLVSVTGAAVTSGSAAGVQFDQFRGGPYVVVHPGGTGLLATTTSFTIKRSLHALASPPPPGVADVVIFDGLTTRMKIASVTNGSIDANNRQSHVITLTAAIGSAVNWTATSTKVVNIFRPKAYVVISVGNRNQLRSFDNSEFGTNFSTSTNYELVCENIGVGTNDITPFSLSTNTDYGSRRLLNVSLRVRDRQFDQRLTKKETSNQSATMQLDVSFAAKGS